MSVPLDPSAKFAEYAHPEVLVSTEWLAANKDLPGLVVVESDEDVLLYETGHIPGAVKIDWHTDLNDPVTRDYVDGEGFAKLLSRSGISRDTTVVIYGDKSNWWASYALWVFKLFGHEDVRLLDGGRDAWIAEGRELTREATAVTPAEYPVVEYSGERTHMPDYPDEGALRGGHIPSAKSVPWARAAGENGVFKSRAELEAIYFEEVGLKAGDDVIAYCRIGERSSHTWFVLNYLLGLPGVRNYDGSWTEWGSLVGVPIVKGTEPGLAPVR